MTSYQYRKSHCGNKTILRPSYLHNGISYTGKMSSLYWIRALVTKETELWCIWLMLCLTFSDFQSGRCCDEAVVWQDGINGWATNYTFNLLSHRVFLSISHRRSKMTSCLPRHAHGFALLIQAYSWHKIMLPPQYFRLKRIVEPGRWSMVDITQQISHDASDCILTPP